MISPLLLFDAQQLVTNLPGMAAPAPATFTSAPKAPAVSMPKVRAPKAPRVQIPKPIQAPPQPQIKPPTPVRKALAPGEATGIKPQVLPPQATQTNPAPAASNPPAQPPTQPPAQAPQQPMQARTPAVKAPKIPKPAKQPKAPKAKKGAPTQPPAPPAKAEFPSVPSNVPLNDSSKAFLRALGGDQAARGLNMNPPSQHARERRTRWAG